MIAGVRVVAQVKHRLGFLYSQVLFHMLCLLPIKSKDINIHNG